ncbi:class I SAM-dependent methyltransferase [Rhizobium sp. CF142]|uniref:class I SAM-dependent methyltransferase n=1 Tax=Rhizobium sp. CF142 TaxID=1144314 RepID=UPI00026EFD4E|nr:methyltransferase domain-containing protein [Rhizobium sp. CF142]EJJ28058.1 methyltransferase family protein [Rhizobium sp. CF142]
MMADDLYNHDLQATLANRRRLKANVNLMYWYEQLYRQLFANEPDFNSWRVLEIGSGTSPLKLYFPNVITSDILNLDYLDLVFDCHDIDALSEIPDHSLDAITLTNVLHHLRDPIRFLRGATRKLRANGSLYMVEPYFSLTSYPLYKLLHHEPVDFSIKRPILDKIDGPLSSSNQALPHMLFFSRNGWEDEIADCYDLSRTRRSYFSAFSYMATGGISRRIPVPPYIYSMCFKIDQAMARAAPKLFASFFTVRLFALGEK